MIKSEPRTEARIQLFQDDDQEEEDRLFKALYPKRMEKIMRADNEAKRLQDEKGEKMRKIEDQLKAELENKLDDFYNALKWNKASNEVQTAKKFFDF